MVLTERANATNLMDIPASLAHANSSLIRLSEYTTKEAQYYLNHYLSFVIVRQPFERVLSAYRNKLEDTLPSAKYFQARVGRYIVKNYRANATRRDLENGDNVTFREFAQYLIREGIRNDVANEHWKPIYELCHPCVINYTFIGKYEQLDEDSDVILKMINAPSVLFPRSKSGQTSERLKQYLRQLSLKDIEQLYRMYEFDFKLFGYNLESILGFDIG
uniref:Carbohydrate sulfotransferase n=2 Tax=Photinus pyralis TaxID=7054 RepID=A0A1Y1JY69_PHOPY